MSVASNTHSNLSHSIVRPTGSIANLIYSRYIIVLILIMTNVKVASQVFVNYERSSCLPFGVCDMLVALDEVTGEGLYGKDREQLAQE